MQHLDHYLLVTIFSTIEAADENAPVEYYNLQGMKVKEPSNGVYIKKQGTKVEKIVTKR